MNISKETLLQLRIEPNTDPYLSTDQMFIRHPIVFPQVELELIDIHPLNVLADQIRIANHELPCFDESGEFDADGSYRFFVTLYGVWPGCENGIEVQYISGRGETTEYYIDLDDESRLLIFAMLNRECENVFDESALDMMLEFAAEEGLGWKGMVNE